MGRELREAIERIHSDDFKKMRKAERKNGKGFWRRVTGYDRLKKTPRGLVMRVVVTVACVAFVACIASATVYYYNQYEAVLVWLEHDKAIWDNELQRRASLLPNLILVSAKYSAHEKVLFEYVSKMRGYPGKGNGEPSSDTPDSPLNKLMSSLLAVSEQYPDLKATQSFEQMMKEWVETENRIAEARASYIKRIRDLNDLYAVFPSNIFGRLFFVANREQWKLDESTAADIDLEKTFQDIQAGQTEVLPERPVESKSVSPAGGRVEPDRALDSRLRGNDVVGGRDAGGGNDTGTQSQQEPANPKTETE